MSGPYTVLLLDAEDCELSNTEYDSKTEAIRSAREKIGPACGNEYQDWVTAQVIDSKREIVWDKHRFKYCKVCGEHHEPDCGTDEFPEAGDLREAS